MGFGEQCFSYLAERYGDYAFVTGVSTVALITFLHLFDSMDWDSKIGRRLARICWAIATGGIVLLILFMADKYPYGPMAFFAFVTPIWLVAIKGAFFSHIDTRTYISWLSGPLLFICVVTGVLWMMWTFIRDENEWNDITRFIYADDAGCYPDFEEYPECESRENPGETCVAYTTGSFFFEMNAQMAAPTLDAQSTTQQNICPPSCSRIYHQCLNTFILWIGPLMASMVLFFLSFFTTFLKSDIGEKDVINFGKVWIFLLFTVWVTSSLAGVAAGVASALGALTLASFIGSAVFVSASISYSDQIDYAFSLRDRIVDKYGDHLNVARGLAVAMLTPAFLIHLVLSFLNQSIRKLDLPCSKKIKSEEERRDIFTRATRRQIQAILAWDRSTVFTYAVYWGAAFFIMIVAVAKLTVLFLSWLIETTSPLGLGPVTGIMVGVGMLMFMFPPVPGIPIYLTAGIVLLAAGRDVLGIAGSMVYGCIVSLIMKLLACTLQQKAIGENLANSVSVRRMVGINSGLVKSMRLILSEPGFSYAKVGILCGGPDWPTSVLCGLMKLNLYPILVGTLPISIIIVPTLLTGSFTYMASLETEAGEPEFPWASILGTIMAASSAMVQFATMIIAAYYLEQTAATRGDELAKIDIDQEVKQQEDKDKVFNECYKKAIQWSDLPLFPKMMLSLSLVTMILSCYLVQLFSRDCFAEYQLTYTIDEHLEGSWLNLILPLGRVACVLFLVSCTLLYVYMCSAKGAAKLLYDNSVENFGKGFEAQGVVKETPSEEDDSCPEEIAAA
jgi:hypothetical protein